MKMTIYTIAGIISMYNCQYLKFALLNKELFEALDFLDVLLNLVVSLTIDNVSFL